MVFFVGNYRFTFCPKKDVVFEKSFALSFWIYECRGFPNDFVVAERMPDMKAEIWRGGGLFVFMSL
jgi:hypothetical protein